MNVQSIDLGYELRQGVEFCLDLAPVVLCRPIASECLSRRELHALGCICDRFSFRPPCVVDPPAQFGEFRLWDNYFLKRTNRTVASCRRAAILYRKVVGHGTPPLFIRLAIQPPDEISANPLGAIHVMTAASAPMLFAEK